MMWLLLQSVSPRLRHSRLGTSSWKPEAKHKWPTSGRPAVLMKPGLNGLNKMTYGRHQSNDVRIEWV